ncbi:MAG: ATP-binding protein [bacterium]|nr:ATP-binding protein [bacterium]
MFTSMIESLQELKRNFSSGISKQFLLWGDVNDYLPVEASLPEDEGYTTLRRFLLNWLKDLVDIVIFYDIASAMEFPIPGHEKKFRELTGLAKRKPPEIDKKALKTMSPKEQKEFLEYVEKIKSMPEPELPTAPTDVLSLVRALMENVFCHKTKPKVAFILPYAETLAPASLGEFSFPDRVNTVNLRHLSVNHEADSKSITILITKNMVDLHASLRGRGSMLKSLEIPLPQPEERLVFSKHTIDNGGLTSEVSPKELAQLTGGLALREIEEILRIEKITTVGVIKREKSRLLEEEFGDILKIMDPRWGLERGLGGLEEIKEYFLKLKPYLLQGDPLMIPPAIMLMGPPGTGKTALAEAIAWEWGVPFVEILNVRSVWHGESEKNALRVWSALQSLYPCVLFWDEFDQEESPRGSFQGDSGVSARLRKMRFQVTSDPRNCGKFLVIYATNRPDLVDSADKRPERASVKIPMLMPDASEQEKIFRIVPARENFDVDPDVGDFKYITSAMRKTHGDFMSGAAIVSLSKLAYRISRLNGHTKVSRDDYCLAIDDFVIPPQEAENIRKWEELAVQERSENSFLSKRGWEIARRLQQKTDKPKTKSSHII